MLEEVARIIKFGACFAGAVFELRTPSAALALAAFVDYPAPAGLTIETYEEADAWRRLLEAVTAHVLEREPEISREFKIGRVVDVVREPEPQLVAEIEQLGGIGPHVVLIPIDMFVQRADRIGLKITYEQVGKRLEAPKHEPLTDRRSDGGGHAEAGRDRAIGSIPATPPVNLTEPGTMVRPSRFLRAPRTRSTSAGARLRRCKVLRSWW